MKELLITWQGGRRFAGGVPERPTLLLDGDAQVAPSPVDALLASLGTCAAIDVVDILAKRRTPVESLTVGVLGERVDDTPRRLKHATLRFTIVGAGIERAQAERAIELAVTKYCSVRASLRDNIGVEWTLELVPSGGTTQSDATVGA